MSAALEKAMGDALAAGEVGLQVAAYRGGSLVVDATVGAVREGGRAVDADTIFWVASAGKVSTATALHLQVARGRLHYEQTVASVWPAFAAEGKGSFTVRDALTHRVGLAALPPDATPELLGDWEWMAARLAASAPSEAPVARDTYHARTWGYVVGEIVRRTDPSGRSFEDFVREEVHAPLGITDLWHRLPAQARSRVAVMKGDILAGPDVTFTVTEQDEINTPAYQDRVDPSGAWMTARAGARLWALYAGGGVLDGTRLLPAASIPAFLDPRHGDVPSGPLVGRHGIIGRGALMLAPGEDVLGFGERRILWHPGAGGALGFADLDADLAVMICHNRLFDAREADRHPFRQIVRAVYADACG